MTQIPETDSQHSLWSDVAFTTHSVVESEPTVYLAGELDLHTRPRAAEALGDGADGRRAQARYERPIESNIVRPMFAIDITVGSRRRTVGLAGKLDLATCAEATTAMCDDPGVPIVVDLSDLVFMDCAGYRAIAAARCIAAEHHTTLTIAGSRGEPARLLALLDELGIA